MGLKINLMEKHKFLDPKENIIFLSLNDFLINSLLKVVFSLDKKKNELFKKENVIL